MLLTLRKTRLGLRNSTTRLPFRYGKACLTSCPQAVLEVVVETDGKRQSGFSGDCLPPGWFDKSPGKDFAAQIDDMLAIIKVAQSVYLEEFERPAPFFATWHRCQDRVQASAEKAGLTPLLASFGSSLLERALIDAVGRAKGVSFHELCHKNLLEIDPGIVHPELGPFKPHDWLPDTPRPWVYVRHTVGLADPLTTADVHAGERLDDGFPQTLEEYLRESGIRYLKIKLTADLDQNLQRLTTIAALVQRHCGEDFHVSVDGNEQFGSADEFRTQIDVLREDSLTRRLLDKAVAIEQPLERAVSFSPDLTAGIRELSGMIPVIIDEADGRLESYKQAIELGYGGVTSKNCKGTIKSLLNAGLTWLHNDRGRAQRFLMTGEDLCSVGIIPVQADLCLAATLGLEHVERNGHHFHPGLSYLPPRQQRAALEAHSDFYVERAGRISPNVKHGRFELGTLQCDGFGFAVVPEMEAMESASEWRYDSLGLSD